MAIERAAACSAVLASFHRPYAPESIMRLRMIIGFMAGALALAPSAGFAQQPSEFDFYVFTLSWSPGFCDTGGADKSPSQCAVGSGTGFVVHGLWPDNSFGRDPQNCQYGVAIPSDALRLTDGVYPDEGLARYEWRKHGSCTGLSPGDYFDSVARARANVVIPESFVKLPSDENLATMDIERAFLDANPRLRPGMLSVGCQRGVLEEVRICLTKDLRDFRACPEVARRGCRSREIRVPAPY